MGKCCRTCRWYQLDICKGHICVNSDNEYGVEWVASYDYCEEWESKEEENYHIPGTPNRNQRMEIERRDRRKRK